MVYFRAAFLTVVVNLVFLVGASLAEKAPDRIVLILDASGSMWGQIKGEPKITIAKDTIREMLEDWDSSVELGLTTYGHRRKGDCSDIEKIIPVGPVDAKRVTRALSNINPKGKTPLSASVKQAAEELRFTEERATVILVSDGLETCDQDPCALARELEQKGVEFTTHVIGFDLGKTEETAQLRCLAEETGGRYLEAADAASLKSSINEAINEVAKARPGVTLVAVHTPGGEPIENVYWEVFAEASSDLKKPQRVASGRGATPTYNLDPGNYQVKVRSVRGKARADTTITVAAETNSREEVVLAEEGIINLKAVTEAGGDPVERVYWKVFSLVPEGSMEKPQVITQGGGDTPKYTLLPGEYDVTVKVSAGQAEGKKRVTVVAGKLVEEEVLIPVEGIVTLKAVNEPNGPAVQQVYWNVYKWQAPDSMEKPTRVKSGGPATPELRLLPGKYVAHVRSNRGKAKAKKEFKVVGGKNITEEVILPAEGVVELVAVNKPGGKLVDRVYWEVKTKVAPDSMEKPEVLVQGGGSKRDVQLLPGTYLVSVRSIPGQAKVEQEIEVVAKKRQRVEILLPEEGRIKLVAVNEPGGKPVAGVYWQLFPRTSPDAMQAPKAIHSGGGPQPEYQALPGLYLAKVKLPKSKGVLEKEVEVVAGKVSKAELVVTDEG